MGQVQLRQVSAVDQRGGQRAQQVVLQVQGSNPPQVGDDGRQLVQVVVGQLEDVQLLELSEERDGVAVSYTHLTLPTRKNV